MSVLQPLPPEDANVIVVVMLTPSHAVDLFIGDLTRKSRSKSGRTAHSYRTVLSKFAEQVEASNQKKIDVSTISPDDCRVFLDNYLRRSQNYQALIYSVMNSFFTWLVKQERIRKNPLLQVERPLRVPAVDLDVVTIETNDVPLLFQACQTDSERLCIAMLAYMGPRRNAVALLRRKHYNREAGLLSFEEKGTKAITKPVPDELRELLDGAIDSGLIAEPDDYLIPPEGTLVRKGDRDDRVIWRLVTRVATRAGVRCTVHALRAAFATYYLESEGEKGLVSLQALMGHSSIATTQIYLRKVNRRAQMEQVRDLRWSRIGVVTPDTAPRNPLRPDLADRAEVRIQTFAEFPGMGAGGFEPPFTDSPAFMRAGDTPSYGESANVAVHSLEEDELPEVV